LEISVAYSNEDGEAANEILLDSTTDDMVPVSSIDEADQNWSSPPNSPMIPFQSDKIGGESNDGLTHPKRTSSMSRNGSFRHETIASQESQEEETITREQRQEDEERVDLDGPYLEPGIVDFVCVVGPKNIGDQRNDDGSKGWVESTPECCVLERFPPTDDFHSRKGRYVTLFLCSYVFLLDPCLFFVSSSTSSWFLS